MVGPALIPEAISFSVIAGVDPKAGLFTACTMAMVIAMVGGRPAMISAATGAVALVVAHIWDASSVATLDAVTIEYAARGKTVEIIGLNQRSAEIHQTPSGELTRY